MINRVSILLANYCPHCVPFSLRNAEKMAKDFGVPLRVLNIENSKQEIEADRLVEKHGDWSVDYLIPQVFVEYADGRVCHVFTGFSEAVPVTEASWEALFSSSYYKNLISEQTVPKHKSLKKFVEKYLRFKGECRRHCGEPTSLVELWSDKNNMVGAYVCPNRYVSRVIYFSIDPDIVWFKKFLLTQVGKEIVNDRDLRPATRYGWELKNSACIEIEDISSTGVIREVYWTTYPTTEEERRRGIFLCFNPQQEKGCKRLFIQDINSTHTVCPKCKQKY
jgi:hypothetical protein